MAEVIRYDVIANFAARGSFAAMRRMGAMLRPVFNHIGGIGQRLNQLGSQIKGTTASTAAGWAKTATAVTAAGGAAGMGAVLKHGLGFNNMMEKNVLQTATMYNLFNFAANSAEVVNGELTQWQYNLQASKAVFGEIYKIAEKTPGSFRDVATIYQSAASGLSTQTEDLRRHMEFLKRAALLGGITDGDYQVLGAQMGRIMSGSAGAEMQTWQILKGPITEAGKKMGIFSKDMKASGDEMVQAFNKLGGDNRLTLMMEAMGKIGPEVADAWANSMDGVVGTTTSVLEDLSGRVSKSLFETIRNGLLSINDPATGVFGNRTSIKRLHDLADQIGAKVAAAGGWLFGKAVHAVKYIRNHWEEIMQGIKNAGVVVAAAIKGAFAFGVSRMIAGTAIQATGGAARGVGGAVELAKKLEPFFSKQARATYEAVIKGMAGTKAVTKMMPKRDPATGKFLKGEKEPVTRLVAGGAWPKFLGGFRSFMGVVGTVVPLLTAATVLLGGFFTMVGGIAVYVISNWESISSALIEGLREGKITLMPLLQAAYGFWARLKIVGEMLLGTGGHVTQFNTVLGWMTGVIGFASSAVAFFLRGMAFFVGIWYTAKLAIYGFMKVLMGVIELMWSVNAVDFKTVSNARQNLANFSAGLDETAGMGAKLLATADKLDKFEFTDVQLAQIEKDAQNMAKSLEDMLAGKGTELEDKKKPGAKVHIQNNYQNIDLRDEDPDRMMSMLINPISRLAERRVESRALPVGGV